LVLPRQAVPDISVTSPSYRESLGRGAYFVQTTSNAICRIFATGSELHLALKVARELEDEYSIDIDVVSFPSWEIFEKQDPAYKSSILDCNCLKVSIEAGVAQGWHKYIGERGIAISVDAFGRSGSPEDLSVHFKFDVTTIKQRIIRKLSTFNGIPEWFQKSGI
ncbi:MAG: hypothetical protein MI867_24640, partial [Pseudomonadales bacterium]|nr:hypothetical protein [Pseudomonadales bacterium]